MILLTLLEWAEAIKIDPQSNQDILLNSIISGTNGNIVRQILIQRTEQNSRFNSSEMLMLRAFH